MTTPARLVAAGYIESPIVQYQGNPLIEALPPIRSEADAAAALALFPEEPGSEVGLSKEVRLHCIDRLLQLVQPLPIHLELESALSSLIRSGYVGRNPLAHSTWRHMYALARGQTSESSFRSTASTLSVVGLSGIGKSTALESILRLYPQAVRHQQYKGHELVQVQIPWLKIECPFDGSLTGLCHAFFRAIDRAIGDERYAKRYRSARGIVPLVHQIEQIASTHFVGMLIIDELQHLRVAKTGGKENMLNFFVNLINSIGIPVVFVGTNSMIDLFSDVMRNARRATGLGLSDFRQPTHDDPAWALLVDAAWQYQWVQHVEPMTAEIRDALYDLTQGVTDILIKLLVLAQRHAIHTGEERLTVKLLRTIADTRMQLLKPALDALRSGDTRRMSKFEDLLPPDSQIAAMMGMLDRETCVSSQLSMLRDIRRPVHASAAQPSPEACEMPQIPATSATTASERIPSEARSLAGHEAPPAALRDAGWLLEDALEFSTAYAAS
ncbi:ATP-binding protein [Paraburkholderia sp.]|uniref:ATP-binding protein n=1 Tax=Paraburkholderia sp. TaxID=1926495 RepID=UPI0025F656A7|nr:ATP-binding protein [Paraburkholderia sp.]